MNIGAEWGAEMGEEVYKMVQNSKEFRLNKVLDVDCSGLKEGKFKYSDSLGEYIIERQDGIQREVGDTYKWISKVRGLNLFNEGELIKIEE